MLITGKGRSGTTWLAQILNTYAHCAYKHEPFLKGKDNPYSEIRRDLESSSVDALRSKYERAAVRAVHGVDQPPFPTHKSVRHQNPKALLSLYRLGSKVSRLRPLFELYAKPHMHEDADVLIKDVNFPNELLGKLCEVIQPHLIPIVRNPFANIASHLKGVEMGEFAGVTSSDLQRIRELIDLHGDDTLKARRDTLDKLTPLQFETVRWRLQVEPLLAFAESFPRCKLVVYEDLCTDPMGTTQGLFDFLNWSIKTTTREFVEQSTSGARSERTTSRAYYSVFRDPKVSMNKWREQLTKEQQADIASIFRESPYTHLWSDLPL